MTTPQPAGLSDLTEIGRGAYGVVYRARQDQLRRFVAVKVLATRLDDEAARRFAHEGRALGALSGHPHIVPVHEAGMSPSGQPYLVMPLCERGSLADRIAHSGPLPWQEMLDFGVRLAGALQTAHDAGILHRDVKPANVLVDAYGGPRLADFGQAHHADSDLTGTGAVVGTPSYAAPEVLRGATASPASDVHALAATLVALVSGRGPYSRHPGENVAAVMYRVLSEPPANLRLLGLPDPVCQVLEWALHKDPRQRPVSAAAFGEAVRGVQSRLGLPATPLTVAGPAQPAQQPTGTTATTTFPTAAVATGPVRATPLWRRQGAPWFFATAFLAVLAIGALVFLQLRELGERDEASNGMPPPPPDASTLLLDSDDYGSRDLRPAQQLDSAFSLLFGEGARPRATDLAVCLKLPVAGVRDLRTSAVYTRGTPVGQAGGSPEFVAAESAGLVMDNDANARAMARRWTGATFDTCREQLIAAGAGLVRGNESPILPEITVDTPPGRQAGPAGTTLATKRVVVPLRKNTGAVNRLYVDFSIMAAGRSVIMTVMQHYPAEPPPEVHDTAVTSMAGKLTR